jgi:hypothetical protein
MTDLAANLTGKSPGRGKFFSVWYSRFFFFCFFFSSPPPNDNHG